MHLVVRSGGPDFDQKFKTIGEHLSNPFRPSVDPIQRGGMLPIKVSRQFELLVLG